MVNGNIRDLPFAEYAERYAPPQCGDGDFVDRFRPVDARDLRTWRRMLRDPMLVIWKKRGPGYLVGRLERVEMRDGTVLVVVRQLAFPDDLGAAGIDELAQRSSVYVDVDESFGAQLRAIEADSQRRIDEARAPLDEEAFDTRIRPLIEARGADNRVREERMAPMRRADAALDVVGGDWSKVDPAAVGIRSGIRRGTPPAGG